ncbi:uncharacterized protein M421DRAFT_415062 [Didymella exigua CBS 183.55]|uniref:Uncharacterized protein n=1 Tax=Didymella exigua CBS 183.55 TaxID=1150837 RepID=A0A6A5S310_9PLEO|nr:uncharacterized protein M421DRAFT_415062 [Didymella exigua CBS 183.55]KAF1934010.1 hypothetical protein M421DRAFT_415062 [Didymella exigua CBS 183.55]
MGLPRATDGSIFTPPQYPLYPEPSPQGRYVLAPSVCSTRLPRKLQHVVSKGEARATMERGAPALDDEGQSEYVVVEPDGRLTVAVEDDCSSYPRASKGHRWSYLPWITEMEESCQPLKLKIRL